MQFFRVIRTKHNMQFFRVIPFIKLQNDTYTTVNGKKIDVELCFWLSYDVFMSSVCPA